MKKFEYTKMTNKEALEELREKAKDSDSVESFLYYLLSESPDNFKEHIENQAASFVAAGENIARVLSAADKDPEVKKKVTKKLHELEAALRSKARQKKKNEETDG